MTADERQEIADLMVEIRGLSLSFALRLEELERLEALASRSADVVWFIDPTAAIHKGPQIDRHLRFVRASLTFARAVRAIVVEEAAEVRERAEREGR